MSPPGVTFDSGVSWQCVWWGPRKWWFSKWKIFSGWWFQTWLWFSISYMGCHPSHWRTPSFFRGVGWNHQPVFYLNKSRRQGEETWPDIARPRNFRPYWSKCRTLRAIWPNVGPKHCSDVLPMCEIGISNWEAQFAPGDFCWPSLYLYGATGFLERSQEIFMTSSKLRHRIGQDRLRNFDDLWSFVILKAGVSPLFFKKLYPAIIHRNWNSKVNHPELCHCPWLW